MIKAQAPIKVLRVYLFRPMPSLITTVICIFVTTDPVLVCGSAILDLTPVVCTEILHTAVLSRRRFLCPSVSLRNEFQTTCALVRGVQAVELEQLVKDRIGGNPKWAHKDCFGGYLPDHVNG